MAASLLRLSSGHYSLEFKPSDIDRVAVILRELAGTPVVEKYPIGTSYTFGCARLAYQNEWDDPCLIAGDEAGDELLEKVLKRLAHTPA